MLSCGGETDRTSVSKVSTIIFEVSEQHLRQDSILILEDINIINTDFEEFFGNIEQIDLNKIEIQTFGLDEDNPPQLQTLSVGVDPILVDTANLFSLQLNNQFISNRFALTNSQGELLNSDKILIFEKESGTGIVASHNEGVEVIMSALRNGTPIQMGIGLDFLRNPGAPFSVQLFLDITALVGLN